VIVREDVRTAPRRHHRNLEHLREGDQIGGGARTEHAGTGKDHGPARSGEEAQNIAHVRWVDVDRAGAERGRGRVGHALIKQILGKREQDGSGPTRSELAERGLDGGRHRRWIADFGGPLGEPPECSRHVDLLECLAAPKPPLHLADDGDHRARIGAGGVHRDGEVGGADGARHESDGRTPCELPVRLGHEAGAILVPGRDDADALRGKRLKQAEETLAGDGERQPNARGAKSSGDVAADGDAGDWLGRR